MVDSIPLRREIPDSSRCYRFKANPEKRSSIFLATKFGFTLESGKGDPEYVKATFNKSLERLGVDYVDLYYQHRTDPKVPIETTVKAMAELVK